MSINSLTEAEVRRPTPRREASFPEMAGPAGVGDPTPPTNNALSMLVKYIPTESVTLYVAAASAVPALKNFSARIDEGSLYWFFGLLTPLLFALILIGKRKAAGVSPSATFKDWPWWKTIAATIAFLVWALAVPGPPDIRGDTSGAIAGVFALFISTFLSILEPIFERPAPGGGA
jgi:hypothetical protein